MNVNYSLAKCKYAQKDYKQAKIHLEDVLNILPEHEDAQKLLKEIEGR